MLRNKGIRIEWNSPVMEIGNSEVIRDIMGMGWGGFDLAFCKIGGSKWFQTSQVYTSHKSNTSQV